MKGKITSQKTWFFKIDRKKTPSENIKRLLEQLSIEQLKLFTKEPMDANASHIFTIDSLGMSGTPAYVDGRLYAIYKALKKMLEEYLNSAESIINKKYEFSLSRNYICEALLTNHENIKKTDKANQIMLCDLNSNKTKPVTLNEVTLTQHIKNDFEQHLTVRNRYLTLLNNYLEIVSERIEINEYKESLFTIGIADNKKEMKILELWLALQHQGFLGHLPDDIGLSKKRKEFFAVFNLTDRNYNDRHNEIKKKKKLGDFLESLAETMKEIYDKKPRQKPFVTI
jgi:hypothetical protein